MIAAILDFIDSNLIIEFCKGCTSTNTFDNNIIKDGVSDKLDAAIKKRNDDNDIFIQSIECNSSRFNVIFTIS